VKRVRQPLGVYEFVNDREVLLILLFPQANALTRRGCRFPEQFETLNSTVDAHVLDELVCFLLNEDSARDSETVGLTDFEDFWADKISASMAVKINYFRIAAILLNDDYKKRWCDLGFYGCRVFEHVLDLYKEQHAESLLSTERDILHLIS